MTAPTIPSRMSSTLSRLTRRVVLDKTGLKEDITSMPTACRNAIAKRSGGTHGHRPCGEALRELIWCDLVKLSGTRFWFFVFCTRVLNVPAGAARRDNHLAGTARSRQGRAVVWRGEANPGRRAPFWHPDNIDGRRSGNMFLLVGLERVLVLDSRADDSLGASATIDHTDIRGSKPQ